jgi:hypothetical protein
MLRAMRALRVEVRIVWDVSQSDTTRLPPGVAQTPAADATWNAMRTLAALVRQHVPDGPVSLLMGWGLEQGPGCLPPEIDASVA